MKISKVIAAGACALALGGAAFAQSNGKRTEQSAEDAYLLNMKAEIITELANSPDHDNKAEALQYIKDELNGSDTSPQIVAALQGLAGEGITTQSRLNGRLMNNFSDIRRDACEMLGEVKTPEAKNTLLQIAKSDRESMVAMTAIRSLGNIGINDNDEVTNTIIAIERRYAVSNPSSPLALEVLFAYEKLADTVEDRQPMLESITNIAANYRYKYSVRSYAIGLLESMKNKADSGSAAEDDEDSGQ